MAARTTRASRGEHPSITNQYEDDTKFTNQKDVKVRKWRKVLVKLGQLKIPRWVPDKEEPTEALQENSKGNKRAFKSAGRRGRKRIAARETREEVIGDLS